MLKLVGVEAGGGGVEVGGLVLKHTVDVEVGGQPNTRAHTYAHAHAHAHTYAHTHAHAQAHTHIHTCAYTYILPLSHKSGNLCTFNCSRMHTIPIIL